MKTNNDNGPSAVLWVDFCGGGGGALYCNPYVMVAQEGLNPGVDGACDAVVKQLLDEFTMRYSIKPTREI